VNAAEPSRLDAPAAKDKLSRFRNVIAAIYFAWSMLQFFGSIGSDAHSWWPLTLYPLIWPLSIGIDQLYHVGLIFFDPKLIPLWFWTMNDYISGFLYIFVGTVWLWLISTFLYKAVARVRNTSPN
jgi:hypothetical protein